MACRVARALADPACTSLIRSKFPCSAEYRNSLLGSEQGKWPCNRLIMKCDPDSNHPDSAKTAQNRKIPCKFPPNRENRTEFPPTETGQGKPHQRPRNKRLYGTPNPQPAGNPALLAGFYYSETEMLGWLAERQGFEPWRRSPAYTLSRRAPSTTRPPLREVAMCRIIAADASRKITVHGLWDAPVRERLECPFHWTVASANTAKSGHIGAARAGRTGQWTGRSIRAGSSAGDASARPPGCAARHRAAQREFRYLPRRTGGRFHGSSRT